ncbi:MAG: acyl-CoA carboxylase subunit beta [Acidobacteria bacterium]|nr:acyl-CoA carboxylase subunit beta [Acidobacteriota bacterium]
MDDLVRELQERKAKLREGGGAQAAAKQRASGKMTARERLEYFFDPGTFLEFDLFARHIGTEHGLDKAELPADGVVTGVGKVNGREVLAYSEDFTVLAGSFGERHGKKITKTVRLARELRVPVVGMNDSGGARITEQMGALSAYGQLFSEQVRASGVVPQIALIMGPVAGGQSYSPALTDFIFMVEKTSFMFIAAPPLVEAVVFEKATSEELGAPSLHASVSGVSDLTAADDRDCLDRAKRLLSYLPSHCVEAPPCSESKDDPQRRTPELLRIIPTEPRRYYDMHDVIAQVIDHGGDDGEFFEIKPQFARNLIVGFARFDGQAVGILANNPLYNAGCLEVDSADKGARFIRFCDAFSIPLVSLVDIPGFLVGKEVERRGLIRHGAKMLFAYAEATVPKITVVVRKGYSGGYLAMGSRDLGADFVFALPTAEVLIMGPEGSVNVLYRKELSAASDPEDARQKLLKEFHDKYVNPYNAAGLQQVDDIIDPQDVRPTIIRALEITRGKRTRWGRRKHGNMPV